MILSDVHKIYSAFIFPSSQVFLSNMSSASNVDGDVDDDVENVDGKSTKLRSSNEMTEIYNFVMTLAWNEINTKHSSMSTEAQQDIMKSLAFDWSKLLKSDFPSVNARMQKSSITEAMIIAKIDTRLFGYQ